MTCFICNSSKQPWLLLSNNFHTDEEGKPIGNTIHTCSYLCSKKIREHLPPNYGNLILNKEDFDYLCPIVSKKEQEFQFLTLEEIMKLSEDKREEYYLRKEENISNDSTKQEIYDEIEREDWNTYQIETEFDSDEDQSDDY